MSAGVSGSPDEMREPQRFDRETVEARLREDAAQQASALWRTLLKLGASHGGWHVEQSIKDVVPGTQLPLAGVGEHRPDQPQFVCPRGHRHYEGLAFCTVCGAGPVLSAVREQEA